MKPSFSADAIVENTLNREGFCCFDTADGCSVITWSNHPPHTSIDGWEAFVRENTKDYSELSSPYSGGVVGWLGYEAGRSVETMPPPLGPRPSHDVCLWRTDGAIVLQHESGHVEVFGSLAFREDAATVLARSSAGTEAPPLCRQPAKSSSAQPPAGQRQQYIDGVRSILRHIEAGDVYQANLAWEQTEISVACAAKAWLRLRRENPASRGCYLRQGGVEIVSNSPELFMNYGPISRCMVSAPIKGTAGVAGGQKAKQALERSPKERAELTMIVDLVRNDLGRVAAIGTVAASKRQIRQCGDLWHAEQTVSATAAMGIDAVSAVAAAFPPGSVTGAPKVKAMSIINDLEAGPRGVYTGAIGWFADGGGAHLNVAIRTATVIDGIGRFHVGAGIVAQSEPEQEWRETLDKARALSRCLSTR